VAEGPLPVRNLQGDIIGVVLDVSDEPGGVYIRLKLDDADSLEARRILYGGTLKVKFGPNFEVSKLPARP
jgi:hypothetical protein